jgi:hypothetical protein
MYYIRGSYLEDFMIHDSLIGSTINIISKKDAFYFSNTHDFYPKNFNHAFFSKNKIINLHE